MSGTAMAKLNKMEKQVSEAVSANQFAGQYSQMSKIPTARTALNQAEVGALFSPNVDSLGYKGAINYGNPMGDFFIPSDQNSPFLV